MIRLRLESGRHEKYACSGRPNGRDAGLPPPRYALRRAAPKRSEGGKGCTTKSRRSIFHRPCCISGLTLRVLSVEFLMRRASLTIVVLVLATACATNPVTGKRELSLMSEAQEIQIGQSQDAVVR